MVGWLVGLVVGYFPLFRKNFERLPGSKVPVLRVDTQGAGHGAVERFKCSAVNPQVFFFSPMVDATENEISGLYACGSAERNLGECCCFHGVWVLGWFIVFGLGWVGLEGAF